jgi:uncharacterized protein YdhG (YjbR/CyaY superfamily)
VVQSKAATVDDYIAEAGDDRRPALERIRQIARETLAGYDEGMAYGMAVYGRGGVGEIAFANQKGYLAVYFMGGDVLERNAELLKGHDCGKGCLRFRRPDRIDYALLRRLMEQRAGA